MVTSANVDIKGDAPDSDAFWSSSQLQLWQAAEDGDKVAVERLLTSPHAPVGGRGFCSRAHP